MPKLTLSDITSGFASIDLQNANNNAIKAAIENSLSRDGSTPNQMNADLDMNGKRILNQLAQSGEGFIWKGAWLTGTVYALNNLVSNSGKSYISTSAHTSGVFGTDLSASKWALFADQGAAGAGTGDMLKAENLSGLTANATARANIGAASTIGYTSTGNIVMAGASIIHAGSSIAAHATTMNPWSLGNYVTLTGAGVTFTGMAAAPQAAAEVEIFMNAAHVFTNGAVFEVDGNQNYTATIGDRVVLRAKSTTVFTVHPRKKDGTAVVTAAAGVTSFNARTGAVTLSSADVTGALAFTPSPNTHTHSGVYVATDAGHNAVGSFVFGLNANASTAAGTTYAGSNLSTFGLSTDTTGATSAGGAAAVNLAGTWRALGHAAAGPHSVTLFQRIA